MQHTASDIPKAGWVAGLPPPLRPYARLARWDRPIGTWLLLFPCWWGLALAGSQDLLLYLLFGAGALAMRGAGCTLNDIVDRDIDGRIARTADRPLPAGDVTVRQAVIFMGLQCLVGLAVLLCLGAHAILLGVLVLAIVAIYPFMKRITWWPQLFLGLAFNWGALMGWAAVTGGTAWPSLLLYAGGIAWTLGYDTIYAHQDKEDDAIVGVKSTARRFGDASGRWIAGFYAAALFLWIIAGWSAGFRWVFLAGAAAAAVHFAWQLRRIDFDDPASCLSLFKANTGVGWLLLTALLFDPVIR
jgi:4-hydroxybenzoate polyprenyltransferase